MSISKTTWLFIGQSAFGLLIGFMVGLSISPVVSTVLGLMFAFIGGSIIVLIKGRNENELEVIGKSIAALSCFMLIGVVIGITFRANDLLAVDSLKFVDSEKPRFKFSQQLNLKNIEFLGANKEYASLICTILKKSKPGKEVVNINNKQLENMIDKKTDPKIIRAMFGYDVNCLQTSAKDVAEKNITLTHLYLDPATGSSQNRDDIPMPELIK